MIGLLIALASVACTGSDLVPCWVDLVVLDAVTKDPICAAQVHGADVHPGSTCTMLWHVRTESSRLVTVSADGYKAADHRVSADKVDCPYGERCTIVRLVPEVTP